MNETSRIIVFDVGSALPETVAFFSQFRSKLHFLDLFSEALLNEQANLEESELRAEFKKLLNFPTGTQLDICLFWDFLNYLDGRSLEVFFQLLTPYITSRTRAHGFGTLTGKTPLIDRQYGIESQNELSVRPRSDRSLTCYPHNQTQMKLSLQGLTIDRGVLMPDGRLEMFLKSTLG